MGRVMLPANTAVSPCSSLLRTFRQEAGETSLAERSKERRLYSQVKSYTDRGGSYPPRMKECGTVSDTRSGREADHK